MLIEYLLVRPLYGRSIDDPLLLTFGLSYVLVEGVRIVFGSDGIPFPTPPSAHRRARSRRRLLPDLPHLRRRRRGRGGLLLLWLGLEKTRFGLIVRAGARDPTMMRVLGVDIGKVWLAGVRSRRRVGRRWAASSSGPMRSVNPEMGIARARGGLRRDRDRWSWLAAGSIVAGLLVGIVISMTALFAPEMATIVMFALMAWSF